MDARICVCCVCVRVCVFGWCSPACLHACLHACVGVYVRACVRANERASVRACVRSCDGRSLWLKSAHSQLRAHSRAAAGRP
eukprot:13955018-Alexandrium_andersonii.AAC.1